MSGKPVLVTLGQQQRPFTCFVCAGKLFVSREIKLNTSGAEFFGMEWANESGTGLVCDGCGYVHTFVRGAVELWKADGGYPAR
jgi:hypothetical protein